DLLLGDAASGEVTRVFRDESQTWVDVVDEVVWLDRNGSCLWVSERGGWRHVYRVPRGGGTPKLLTTFDADVIEVAAVDEPGGWLYVLASPGNATERYLYRAHLDGSGAPERVTPADQPGSHHYDLAPGGRFAFHTWSRLDLVPHMDLVELPSH